MKTFPLSKTHFWIKSGPVILVTTARKGQLNVMTAGFHMMMQHVPPLIGLSLGPWNTLMVRKYNLFILEVVKVWIDPNRKERRTIHHKGNGTFIVDGRNSL